MSFLDKLGRALSEEGQTPVESRAGLTIDVDGATGQRHLRLPLPSKEFLRDIAGLLSQLAERL